MKILSLLCSLAFLLLAGQQDEVPLLRWVDPYGLQPDTYEEWIVKHPPMPSSYIVDRIAYGDGRAGTVAILTEQSIAPALTSELNQLTNNMQREGYTVLSYQVTGGTPETLRSFLRNLYNSNQIEGALFIGNLPVCWFEIDNDFNTNGYVQFPIDLFYMDLDGNWLDTMSTGNGKYDGHDGEINPEIYIGRLLSTGIGTDTVLLKNYFRKNNAYRHDTLALQQRALFFLDDDWIPWANQWAYDVSQLYPDTMNYWDAETTRASSYRAKLDTVQAWVAVFAHSSPSGHVFYYNNRSRYDWYYSTEYTSQNPPANFYNHFACSFARYTTGGYGGGRSIFNQSHGLGAIGSTKTGSMLEFFYFYQPLSQKKTLGEGFKDWFTYITHNGVEFMELCWHYGMTLLADPFLKPTGHIVSIDEATTNITNRQSLCILNSISNKNVVIQLDIEKPSRVDISVYDCLGRRVNKLLTNKNISAGLRIVWPFADAQGAPLPKGIYLIELKVDKETHCRKVIKL